MTEVTARVGSIVIDTQDPDELVPFWREILGLEEQARYPGFVWLSAISDGGPALAFQRVPEEKAGKNRLHLDLGHPDPEAFVSKVEALGGSRLADHEIDGFHWTVLADPEGNEFCVAKSE